uniref:Uncharacterized protein n=1 Tax=Fagus sylvatica TaxID=28930 RepID=A0A2N9I9T4_FAGSY
MREFPQTVPIDVSRKPVDGSQGERQSGRPAKGNEGVISTISVHCSYLSTEGERRFMPFGHPRGLLEVVGSCDAWRARYPSSDRQWPDRAGCWATLRGLHSRDSRRTPVHDEVLIW